MIHHHGRNGARCWTGDSALWGACLRWLSALITDTAEEMDAEGDLDLGAEGADVSDSASTVVADASSYGAMIVSETES